MADPKVQALLGEIEEMKKARRTWELLWTEASELVLPSRPFLPADTGPIQPYGLPKSRVFDSLPIIANEMFAATLASQLINPQIRWFALRAPSEQLQSSRAVRLWVEAVEGVLRERFSKPGFVASAHEAFLEMGAFGTCVFFAQEAKFGEVEFVARPLAEIYLRQDALGKVDALARIFELTLRQALRLFGELPEKMARRAEKTPEERVTFAHYVYFRPEGRANRPGPQKPWASCFLAPAEGVIVRESGFDDFPFMIARWLRAPDELYGRGPGTTTLPDNRLLQRVKEVTIRAAQKAIDPPLLVPDDGLIGPIRTAPGRITTVRVGLRKEDQPRPLLTGARPDFGETFSDSIRETILRAFFVDPGLLATPEPRVTATAIIDSRDMRFQRMTPMIERLQAEFLVPLIERTFNILQRANRLPPPPPELLGQDLVVDFVSPAALAQLVTEADNMTRFLARIAPLGPDALASLDTDSYVRRMARNLSIPEEVILDARTAQARRDAAAQADTVGQFATGATGARDFSEGLRNVAALQQGQA